MPYDYVQGIYFLTPITPKSHMGHGPGDRIEIPSIVICFISFICEKTHEFGLKVFGIDYVIERGSHMRPRMDFHQALHVEYL